MPTPVRGRDRRVLGVRRVVLDGAAFKERPIAVLAGHVKTPLRLPAFECELIETATCREIPLGVGSCPMAGATSPFTLAGTLVLTVAETLFMAVAAQLCRPGHPLHAGSSLFGFNMKAGNVSAGGVETKLLEAAYVELMHDFHLPAVATFTFVDPDGADYQAGLEAASKALASVLVDADILGGLGSVGNASGVSAEKIVLDHDLLEMIMRFREGVRVDDETLAAGALREAGPGGNFLGCGHTVTHLRSGEHYYGGGFVREGEGSTTMLERAHERVVAIAREHRPDVPETRQQALRRRAEQLEVELSSRVSA